MKRSLFVKALFAVPTFLAAPFTAIAIRYRERVGKGLTVKAGKDRFDKPISLFEGDTFYMKVSTKDTDGDIYVFESTRVNEGCPSYHLHFDQDEFWYIIKGEFLFKVGEENFTAKTGDTVFGPRNVPNAFSKTGTGVSKISRNV